MKKAYPSELVTHAQFRASVFLALLVSLFSACQPGLEHQPKIGILAEPKSPVEGTIPYTPVDQEVPIISRALVMRGKERFAIYCSVCHGLTGEGDGLATQRGFGAPISFKDLKDESMSVDSVQSTIDKGNGRMAAFANRIPFLDRYAIAVYAQVLRLRLKFPVSKLTDEDRTHLPRSTP